MDYEKKYKDALEWARKVMQGKVGFVLDEVLEKFPELKESEGERVRKEIISAIKEDWPGHTDWIAWLEKQGEHANFRNKIQIGDKVTRNKDGVLVNLSQLNRVAKKQGEQKPAIKLERDENGEPVLTPFEAGLFSMMSEAWQGYSFGEEVNLAKIVKEHSIELLERANEQKPATWSEEDEEMLSNIIKDLVHPWNEYIPDRIEEEIKWLKNKLKSLKERYTCKPSDEQMEALQESIGIVGQLTIKSGYLKELYEQLKKLREGEYA